LGLQERGERLTQKTSLLAVLVLLVAFGAAVLALFLTTGREADAASQAPAAPDGSLARQTLHRYAEDTWASFVAMTDPNTGLPADTLREDGERSVKTSTTNIGAYIWSTVVAEELGIIGHAEAVARLDRTLTTLEGMERHEPSGQYYNWYDIRNGEKLTQWPETGLPLRPWLSSVDNGWLAVGLQLVRNAALDPELSSRAGAIYDSMDFGFYYRPEANRILFHYAPPTATEPESAPCCYDTIVSESRIASYIGIGKGEIPQRHYFGAYRAFPNTCDWSFQETRPVGHHRPYYGVDVFEGAYEYNGWRIVPSWGGSVFEAAMPALLAPEEQWAPQR